MLATPRPTCFLIADISGYTGYLADVELDHAQDILADLVGAVVSALRPDFRLAKLEGDAAFMFMSAKTADSPVDGSMLLDIIERCYFVFRRRRLDVRQATS
jgi:class 3 adenylate cyclase